jgi:zinc transporter ZupT
MNDETNVPPQAPGAEAAPPPQVSEQKSFLWGEAEIYRKNMQSGARWFYWIAGLSLINAIAAAANSNWSFLAGLGVTQFISGLASGLSGGESNVVTIIAFVLNLIVAGFFVFLGVFAYKGHTWAFIVGLVIYALDALIFLVVGLWFPLAFHAFVIYCLYRGLAANRRVKQLEAEMATAT